MPTAVYIGENEVAANSINPAKVQPVDLAARHLWRVGAQPRYSQNGNVCAPEQINLLAITNNAALESARLLASLWRARRRDNKFPVQFALCGLISRSLPFIMQQVIIVPVVLQQKNLISPASQWRKGKWK